MCAKILDGKSLSLQILNELDQQVSQLIQKGVRPRIDFIFAANDPASTTYVGMKSKLANQLGMVSRTYPIDDSTPLKEVLALIEQLNSKPEVHGILVQHPLPSHLDQRKILDHLGSKKDVDGMTPDSLGKLISDVAGFRCATALGIMTLLERNNIEIEGKNAVVIGRSIIVGKPAALMLLKRNATVTIAHSKSKSLPELCSHADILVVGIGQPEMIRGEWLKPGVVVVDAGYNRVEGRIQDVGDVHFESASQIASWITPVPGGVGPMTVVSLLKNTYEAAKKTLS
jgi:methylenetetrahydrofolate dehydrogenase (NADP+)/methenyltetrahydrofolate cyclohydrolase